MDTVHDGAAAITTLEQAADGTYAGVLMDIQMPVMDGLSAVRALRQNPRFVRLPVIAMTAHAARQDIQHSREAGMNDHLSKPVLEAALWRVLLRWLSPAADGPISAAADSASEPSTASPALDLTAAATDVAIYRIDPTPLHELRPLFSHARLDSLVSTFVRDCAARVAHMASAAAATPPDWVTLQRHAHSLGGTAGSFGLHQVGQWASALSSAAKAQDAASTAQLMQHITQGTEHGLAELLALHEAA